VLGGYVLACITSAVFPKFYSDELSMWWVDCIRNRGFADKWFCSQSIRGLVILWMCSLIFLECEGKLG